jgi:hypothetical protein
MASEVEVRLEKSKPDRGFRRSGAEIRSERAKAPNFRAGLGEWARKSGCALLRMTAFLDRGGEVLAG